MLFLFLSDSPEEAECRLRNYEVQCDHTPHPQAAILAYSYMATVARVVQQNPATRLDSVHQICHSIEKNACTWQPNTGLLVLLKEGT